MSLITQIQALATRIATECKSIRTALSGYVSKTGSQTMQGPIIVQNPYGWPSLQFGVGNYRWRFIYNGNSATALSPFVIQGTTDGFTNSFIKGFQLESDGTPSFEVPIPITSGGTGATSAAAARLSLGGGTYSLVVGGMNPGDIYGTAVGLTSYGYPYIGYTDSNNAAQQKILAEQKRMILVGGYGVMSDVSAYRAINTTYTNSTGRPLIVQVAMAIPSPYTSGFWVSIDGNMSEYREGNGTNIARALQVLVPEGSTYILRVSDTSSTIVEWREG